jgi:predicted TIM-barrel fold metal-dependent hydrolase
MIIDAHTHLNKTDDEPDFSVAVERLLAEMNQNGVEKAVIIANTISRTNCANMEEILDSVGSDDRFYIIGSPDIMNERDNKLNYTECLLQKKKIVGLKLFPGHETFYPTDTRCEPVYRLALRYNCPVVIHTGINSGDFDCAKYNDPKYIVEVAQRYPKLRIIIAHYFWPKIEYCFNLTKNIPNIYYDISVMADDEVVELSDGIETISQILEKTVSRKPNSVIFGSDFSMCDMKTHIELVYNLTIEGELRGKILSENFLNCFALQR